MIKSARFKSNKASNAYRRGDKFRVIITLERVSCSVAFKATRA